MYAVEKLSSYITRGVYTVSGPFHPFGGAVDIIVVQQQDGTFKSSPWYVSFGKFQGVLKARENVVSICVNGVKAGFHMYLDHKGEAYFLKDCDLNEAGDFELSPPSSGDELDEKIRSLRFNRVQSCNYDGGQKEPIVPFENGNGAIVSRTSSKRSRLLGLMFGKSVKENDKGANVDRVSSLESAEIAADLLETKWLTNLPSNDTRIDDPSEKVDSVVGMVNNEMVSSHEEGKDDSFGSGVVSRELFYGEAIPIPLMVVTNSIGDDQNPCLGTDSSVKESVDSYDEKLGQNLRPAKMHFEDTITQTSTPRTHEEVVEVYTLKTVDLGDGRKLDSESVMMEADECSITSKGPIPENFTDGTQNSVSIADEENSVAPEENYGGGKEVSSSSCVATPESSTFNFEASIQTHNTLNILSGGDHDYEVTCKTIEHICELPSWTDSEKATENENCVVCQSQDSEFSRSQDFRDSQTHSPGNIAFQDTKINGSNVDTIRMSRSPEPEVRCQERETTELSQANTSNYEEANFVQNRFQAIEEAALEPICQIPLSNGVSFISNGGQESKGSQKGVTGEKPCNQNMPNIVPEESRFSVSESLDEDQFQFSDIHSFSIKRINHEVNVSNVEAETNGRDVEENETECTDHEECFESVSDVSGSRSSRVSIPINIAQALEIVQSRDRELLAKSLPIIRSKIHDLENSNLLRPLSCSLDLSSKNYEHDSLKKEILSYSKLESETGSFCSTQAAATAGDSEDAQGHGVGPINSTVEMSLCKHLLFEGMGADAASRVFETNKVDLEKFSTLGSSVVKNDKLVVRIGSRYFPWDAAAPIILGMLCFGQGEIIEPKGMIAVDKDEKKLSGDPSVPSGGSWKLWPFSSKKSTTLSTVHSVPESTTQENVVALPLRSQSLMGPDDVQKTEFTNKKVRSLTPTSKELASLNLKEGRNVITFSFSTAMLGQQQVDAVIYLWKWNTRIVISDVDGTITRSDVLGQFMPLVGKDWSQTGVAHLFSAIKENGYQFLFLSARAISQAYLTRQFLFNLKQDGKALPDGPVVISPDGLFPSLYREVIRRAPHEFKISCLEDIRALFPSECNPFYAGFGNRYTDEISYLKVGIPKGKIFIINPKGEVAVNRQVDTKSYTKLHALVNRMFPPMSTAEQEDYNSWNYWKLPLPDIDV